MEHLIAAEFKRVLKKYGLRGVDYHKTLKLLKLAIIEHAIEHNSTLTAQEAALNLKQSTYSMIRKHLGVNFGKQAGPKERLETV